MSITDADQMHDLKIWSDGHGIGTRIMVGDTPLLGCTSVTWRVDTDTMVATAVAEIDVVHLDAEARALIVPARDTRFRYRVRLAWAILRGRP